MAMRVANHREVEADVRERRFWGTLAVLAFSVVLIPKSGVKFTLFVQICPRIGGLLSKFMQQSIRYHEGSFRVQPFSGFNL
jgi:hypothetical protein